MENSLRGNPMKIITITLNPAYDVHFIMKDFKLYKENYVDSSIQEAGGKGINISRALLKSNIASTAYVVLGEQNAADFVSQLKKDGIDFKELYCEGKIRENITIHTPNEPETRISRESHLFSVEIMEKLSAELKQTADRNTIVTFSGRLPKGLSLEKAEHFLEELKSYGCHLVVDCNSFSMYALLRIKPWLIKPNEQEVFALTREKIETIEQAMASAKMIREMGIENVIISMGKEGAVISSSALNCALDCIAKAPSITPVSTIGAGDSMLAGFIGAFSKGAEIEECFKTAVAFGTAACLTQGTLPPKPEDIAQLKHEVEIIRFK